MFWHILKSMYTLIFMYISYILNNFILPHIFMNVIYIKGTINMIVTFSKISSNKKYQIL